MLSKLLGYAILVTAGKSLIAPFDSFSTSCPVLSVQFSSINFIVAAAEPLMRYFSFAPLLVAFLDIITRCFEWRPRCAVRCFLGTLHVLYSSIVNMRYFQSLRSNCSVSNGILFHVDSRHVRCSALNECVRKEGTRPEIDKRGE